MQVGLQIIRFDWPGNPGNIGPRLVEISQAAEQAGFASLWVMDHFFQMEGMAPATDPMLEAYTTLGYMAACTRRIRLGALVTGVIYRYPGILAKTITTLDVLSGGRAWLGLGAAWYEREARGLGVPFPPLAVRYEQLEETLEIVKQVWRDDAAPYTGRHFELREPIMRPQPLCRPHPPILIGGEGEKKTLRLVAQYADACNLWVGSGTEQLEARAAEVRRKLDVLKRHCDAVGRAYEAVERTALAQVWLKSDGACPQGVVGLCRALAQAGIQHVIFNMPNTHEPEVVKAFEREIIPAVAEL